MMNSVSFVTSLIAIRMLPNKNGIFLTRNQLLPETSDSEEKRNLQAACTC